MAIRPFVEPLLRVSERNAILVWAFPSESNLGEATFDARDSCLVRGKYVCNGVIFSAPANVVR
ncbi:MAG: hypothetical protein J6J06_00005 [Bacteroidaceae bacterium]|nr:hypothetical protein [Bacteroidaceae bacterium]